MNRDETLIRPAGLPPKRKVVEGRVVLCPSEPGGGTWIALNDRGACLALINWYAVAARIVRGAISRGEVVKTVSGAGSPGSADAALRKLPLGHINPFRLVGVFLETREVVEWRWNLKALTVKNHRWRTQQWISSGYDEPVAQQVRGKTFKQAFHQRSAGRLAWLRRLHHSHSPKSGPFSICMHRKDAATVSYTEVAVFPKQAKMCYHCGAPCRPSKHYVRYVHLQRPTLVNQSRSAKLLTEMPTMLV
jgi:hypothetical protein